MLRIKINEKGFTLIELITTIFILSLLLGGVVFSVTNILSNSKDKSINASLENIKAAANDYSIENSDKISWINDKNNTEFTCISIDTLVNYGFFDKNIVSNEALENNRYVKINRNSISKSVINEDISQNSDGICGRYYIKEPKCTNPVYNGSNQNLVNYIDNEKYSLSIQKAKDAGEYNVNVSLKNKDYRWLDGSNNELDLNCKIEKKQVDISLNESEILIPDFYFNDNIYDKTKEAIDDYKYYSKISEQLRNSLVSLNQTVTFDLVKNNDSTRLLINNLEIIEENKNVKDNYYLNTKQFNLFVINTKLNIPTSDEYCIQGLKYNGSEQIIAKVPVNTIISNYKKTDAGNYDVTVNPNKLEIIRNGKKYSWGNYTYTWVDGSNNEKQIQCKIDKIDATCPAKINSYDNKYDDYPHGISVSEYSGGEVQYSEDKLYWSASSPTLTEVGSTTVYVKIVGDENHNSIDDCGSGTITINKSDAVCPTTINSYDNKYDGNAHGISVSEYSGGEVQYSEDTLYWLASSPTLTNIGSKTVYVKIVGDKNHNSKDDCGSGTIRVRSDINCTNVGDTIDYAGDSWTIINKNSDTCTLAMNATSSVSGTYTDRLYNLNNEYFGTGKNLQIRRDRGELYPVSGNYYMDSNSNSSSGLSSGVYWIDSGKVQNNGSALKRYTVNNSYNVITGGHRQNIYEETISQTVKIMKDKIKTGTTTADKPSETIVCNSKSQCSVNNGNSTFSYQEHTKTDTYKHHSRKLSMATFATSFASGGSMGEYNDGASGITFGDAREYGNGNPSNNENVVQFRLSTFELNGNFNKGITGNTYLRKIKEKVFFSPCTNTADETLNDRWRYRISAYYNGPNYNGYDYYKFTFQRRNSTEWYNDNTSDEGQYNGPTRYDVYHFYIMAGTTTINNNVYDYYNNVDSTQAGACLTYYKHEIKNKSTNIYYRPTIKVKI